jgi:pilus assembly protein CpaB
MNRNKMAMALGIALLVSGICTAVLAHQISNRKKTATVENNYVALAKPVVSGGVIKAEDLKMIAWPANVPLAGGFMHTQDVIGRTALVALAQDSPVLNQNLAAPGTGVGLSLKIPDGMRAISLKSDDVVGVSGFLFPGSHVDVLVTYKLNNGQSDPMTATVLQNAEVLAAGKKLSADPEGKAADVNEVTLLLNPEDSAKAVLASNQGTIHFVLRNGVDASEDKAPPVQMTQLGGAAPIVAPKNVTKVSWAPIHDSKAHNIIETVSGDKSTTASF